MAALCMTPLLNDYERLKAQGSASGLEFWDVVLLTATDEPQHDVYKQEINSRRDSGKLPSVATYHVVHDPPDAKIGSGGSTMYALSELKHLEPDWKSKKVLLMHAGGSSQRLPGTSVLGKAFTPVPVGDLLYTMFDVKLALCMPFARILPKGVFLCCADTFETFTFGNVSENSLRNELCDFKGFVALAHPSPISIGKGHGVYILSNLDDSKDTELLQCDKVLQKPTERLMRDEGAVIEARQVPDYIRNSANSSQEWVFTDSVFFFDHTVSEMLIGFYERKKPLVDEICAYGDFLQPLGKNADPSYISNCNNVVRVSENLLTTRREMYDLLHNTPLKVLMLKHSKFYHIGTMSEYLENFCENVELKSELGLTSFYFSAVLRSRANNLNGCVMHSLVSDGCEFDSCSVVEFCHFDSPVVIEDRCVVSNCTFLGKSSVTIPSSTFLQTVPVFDNDGNTRYVTLCFSVNDEMKAKAASKEAAGLIKYCGATLQDACVVLRTFLDKMFANDEPITLWHAKLFPLSSSPHESFCLALNIINQLKSKELVCQNASKAGALINSCCNGYSTTGSCASLLYSFADIIKRKNADFMRQRRHELGDLIHTAKSV